MEKGMVKTVIVKDLNKVSKKGTTYSVYNIEIEQNGIILKGKTLTFGEMTECKFKEGQETEFTKEPDKYNEGCFEFRWGAEKKGGGYGGGYSRQPENPKIRNISFACSYAKDIYAARLKTDKPQTLEEMLKTGDMLWDWMNEKVDRLK